MKPFNKNKSRAQTMVEFALVLPILMMLVFGLLEVGRMAFVYVTIASASREAVRYGSASGLNTTGGINKYRDCIGIRAASQNVDFLNSFNDDNIIIEYYHKGSSTKFSSCPVGGVGPSVISNGDRIFVRVTGNFEPIVSFIPLLTRTVANGNPITSQNFHTLIGSAQVPIVWSPHGEVGEGGEDPCINCFKPNIDICPNLDDPTTLPEDYFRDWLGNCYPDPINNDYCLNLTGKQKSMPLGFYYDEVAPLDRICVALDSLDVCPNLEGVQESVPTPYIFDDASGYCVIDYCSNLDGIQYALPSSKWYDRYTDPTAVETRTCYDKPVCGQGYVCDYSLFPLAEGASCCVPITDYCTNFPGPQNAIPDGYVRDEDGSCNPIPVCRYSSNGEVPMKIVEGTTSNDPTIWYIKNETNNPLKIISVFINWDDTDSKLFLKSLYLGAFKISNINVSVSGYYPLANGESILINGGETLQVGLTYSYDKPAPNEINVATEIMVVFGTDRCYFGADPDGVLPDQPYCSDGNNYLFSNCAAQSK